MRRTLTTFLLLALATTAQAATAQAASYKVNGITISAPWSRATFGPGGTAIAFMTIDNQGPADALTGASCDGAGLAALHDEKSGTMEMPGMAAMRTDSMPLLDQIPIPQNGHVELKPGSLHIMLQDMQVGYMVGQQVKCVLHFQQAGSINIVLKVARAGATRPPK